MGVALIGMKTTLVRCTSPSELLGHQVPINSNISKEIFFLEPSISTLGLKYTLKHAVNRYAAIHSLFFHLYSTDRVELAFFLRILGIIKVTNSIGFSLKSLAASTPNKRVILALRFSQMLWLLPSYEDPRWHFFQYNTVLSTLKVGAV